MHAALLGVAVAAVVFVALSVLRPSRSSSSSSSVPRVPLWRVLLGLRNPGAFLADSRARYGDVVEVKLPLMNPLVFVGGARGAVQFHQSKELDFNAGYEVLLGSQMPSGWFADARSKHMFAPLTNDVYARVVGITQRGLDAHYRARGREGRVPLFKDVGDLVLKLFSRCLVGEELTDQPERWARYERRFRSLDPEADLTDVLGALRTIMSPASLRRRRNADIDDVVRIIDEVARERSSSKSFDGARDYLALLIKEYTRPDGSVDLREAALTLVGITFAGQTNTFATLSWLLFYAQSNAKLRQAITDEMRAAKAKTGGALTLDSLNDMPLVDRVIKEVIRKHAPGAAMRRATADVEIEGKRIRKGTLVCFSHYAFHMDAIMFANPNDFDPERFTRGEGSQTCGLLVWGAGRHPCLGMRLAQQIMKTVLDYAIENWEWSISTQPQPPARQIVGVHRPVNNVELSYRFVN